MKSQQFAATGTARIPQDLSIAPTITRDLLKDPNTLLCNQIEGLRIVLTDVIEIATKSALPGGGVVNIGFLMGDSKGPNARAARDIGHLVDRDCANTYPGRPTESRWLT